MTPVSCPAQSSNATVPAAVLSIAESWPVGPVDQFRDLLWPATNRRALLRLFDQKG